MGLKIQETYKIEFRWIKSFKIYIKNLKAFYCSRNISKSWGSLKKAKMIDAAKKAGASAVKIQTYEADSMTIKSNKKDFKIKHGIWKGKNLYDLYEAAKTPFAWHESLFKYAKEKKYLFFQHHLITKV